MGGPDPRIERYLAKDRPWRAELLALRTILLSEGLGETLKWRAPCYTAHGGNVAIIGGLSDAAICSFLKGVLIDDPAGLLVPPGPNSRSARYFRASGLEEISRREGALRGLVRQAIEIERLGRKVDMPADDLALPPELADALRADADLARAWEALTPGRRRGYVVTLAGAKLPATRQARIGRWRPLILAGKGLHDR